MKKFYDGYWSEDIPDPRSDPLTPERRAHLWKMAMRYLPRSFRLLDVGAGDGDLLSDATSRDIDAEGIELSAVAVASARSRTPPIVVHEHAIEDLPWPVTNESFDVVTSFEVIEHLVQPELLLRGAHSALRPGGYLALTTPYHGMLKNIAIATVAFDSHYDVTGPHIRYFTDTSLRRMLESEGFTILDVTHYGRLWPLWSGVFVWAGRT